MYTLALLKKKLKFRPIFKRSEWWIVSTQICFGDLLICSQMLYLWAVPTPTGARLTIFMSRATPRPPVTWVTTLSWTLFRGACACMRQNSSPWGVYKTQIPFLRIVELRTQLQSWCWQQHCHWLLERSSESQQCPLWQNLWRQISFNWGVLPDTGPNSPDPADPILDSGYNLWWRMALPASCS